MHTINAIPIRVPISVIINWFIWNSPVIKSKEGEYTNTNGTNAFAIDYEIDFFIAEEYLKGNIKPEQL